MVESAPAWLRAATGLFLIIVLAFVLGPLIVVVGVSFTAGDFVSFPPQGLSLRWYEHVLSSGVYTSAAYTSLKLAVVVTISATLIGAAAAIASDVTCTISAVTPAASASQAAIWFHVTDTSEVM